MAVATYCVSFTDLPKLVRDLNIGGGLDDNVTSDVWDLFTPLGDEWLDSQLNHMYFIPLRKIQYRGSLRWPPYVSRAASLWALGQLYESEYSSSDPNRVESATACRGQALRALEYLRGKSGIPGQRLKSRDHFSPPTMPFREQEEPGEVV